MEHNFSRPIRERGSTSSTTPSITILPTIDEVVSQGVPEVPKPRPRPKSAPMLWTRPATAPMPKMNPSSAKFTPNLTVSTLAQSEIFLAYPSDWPTFEHAFRERCVDLKIAAYIFGNEPFPRQPITLMIPYSPGQELEDELVFSSLQEYEDRIDVRRVNGRWASGSTETIEKLEQLNSNVGTQAKAFKQFLEVRKAVEKLRLWLVGAVSGLLKERCLAGIEDGLRGQDSRNWYLNLRKLVYFWRGQGKARIRYLYLWCKLLERPVTTKRELLGWIKKLTRIIREGLLYRVEEVMDFEIVFTKHLAGFGILKAAFKETTGGAQIFLQSIVSEILLERFNWQRAMQHICGPLQYALIMGRGEEMVTFNVYGPDAREELGRMRQDMHELVRLDRARGRDGSEAISSHLIPTMDIVPREGQDALNHTETDVEAMESAALSSRHRLIKTAKAGGVYYIEAEDEEQGVRVAETMEEEDSDRELGDSFSITSSVRGRVAESEYADLTKLTRQYTDENLKPLTMRGRVKNWAQSMKPGKRFKAMFAANKAVAA
ncbi:hypothetical protein V8F06_007674 [Rhypophila decipiens]